MKKMFVAFGIAIAVLVGGFMMFNQPINADELNAQAYEQVVAGIEARYGEDADYKINPVITRDGVVERYRVRVADEWGDYTITRYVDVDFA